MANDDGMSGAQAAADVRDVVMFALIGVLVPLTITVVALRFYSRVYLTSRLVGADDWVTLVSLSLLISVATTQLLMTRTGLGYHKSTLSEEQIFNYNRLFYIDVAFYIACLGSIKMQILLQYHRVFIIKMRRATLVAMGIVGFWSIGCWLAVMFTCNPIAGFWDKSLDAKCIPPLFQWYMNAAGNITTDVIIFALPLPVLWRLSLPLSERLSLIGIFCLGFFVACISMIRISSLKPASGGDFTYTNVDASSWSLTELSVGIIVSCLPTLRPLLRKAIRPFRKLTAEGSGDSGKSGGLRDGMCKLADRTVGGGYVEGNGSQESASNRARKGRNESALDTMASSKRSNSVVELTWLEDVESGTSFSGRKVTNVVQLQTSSMESISSTDLPIQHPPGTSITSLQDEVSEWFTSLSPAPSCDGKRMSAEHQEILLGLRNGTTTSIRADSDILAYQQSLGLGIMVKTDVTYTYNSHD